MPDRPVAKLFTPVTLSAYADIPVATLYRWHSRKEELGTVAIRMGRHLRWRPEDVDAWLMARRGGSPIQ